MSTVRIPEGVVVWAVIVKERHSDIDVEVWSSRESAVARAWEVARDYAREESDIEDVTNEAMLRQDWVLSLNFSCESDSVEVMKKEIRFV